MLRHHIAIDRHLVDENLVVYGARIVNRRTGETFYTPIASASRWQAFRFALHCISKGWHTTEATDELPY
jgi:hypothetical protein